MSLRFVSWPIKGAIKRWYCIFFRKNIFCHKHQSEVTKRPNYMAVRKCITVYSVLAFKIWNNVLEGWRQIKEVYQSNFPFHILGHTEKLLRLHGHHYRNRDVGASPIKIIENGLRYIIPIKMISFAQNFYLVRPKAQVKVSIHRELMAICSNYYSVLWLHPAIKLFISLSDKVVRMKFYWPHIKLFHVKHQSTSFWFMEGFWRMNETCLGILSKILLLGLYQQ